MKRLILTMIILAVASTKLFAVDLLLSDFGEVPQGTKVVKQFAVDAGTFTLTGDTPFDLAPVFPFQVSPTSGKMRRVINTVFTVTLPASTPPGKYDVVLKVIVHKNSGDKVIQVPAKATVLGFPFQINPLGPLDLGNSSTGTIQIKNIGGSIESYTADSENGVYSVHPFGITNISPGETQTISISPGQGLPDSGPASDRVSIKHIRTNEARAVTVKTNVVGQKPDLVGSVVLVTIFPHAPGETKTTLRVIYSLQNIGFRSSIPCAGKITLDNDKVVDITIPEVSTGQIIQDLTTTQSFQTTATGSHKVKVVLDIDDKNDEIQENNNVGIKDVNIP